MVIRCGTGQFDYYAMAAFLQAHSADGEELISTHGAWSPKSVEVTEDKQLFDEVVQHFWPDGGLELWLRPLRCQAMAKHLDARGRLSANATRQAVHVSAKDRATGKEQAITITGQSAVAPEEIERMVADAEAHATEELSGVTQAVTRKLYDAAGGASPGGDDDVVDAEIADEGTTAA